MATRATPISDHEPPSITARILAPLALIACVVAVLVLVSGTLSGGGDGGGADDGDRTPRQERKNDRPQITGDTYTVVPGDTFSGIAAKAGIPLLRLERLNPKVDPVTLNAGQQIKLSR